MNMPDTVKMGGLGVYRSQTQGREHNVVVSPQTRLIVGRRLRAARMALGYTEPRGRTQAAFYRLFGYSRARGNHWELGRALPNTDFLIALHQRFEITADWILLGRPAGLPARIANEIINNFSKLDV